MTLQRSIEVFVRAICIARSHTHPYVVTQIDGLWIMQDAPGRKEPRTIEVIAYDQSPEHVVNSIHRAGLGRHCVCHIHTVDDDFAGIRAGYKELGYRAQSTQWMFHHDLRDIPVFQSDPPVRVVRTQAEADAIPQMAKQKWPVRGPGTQFAIYDDKRDYGWAKDIPYESAAWVQGLHVRPDVRGQGYGRALMSAVLQLNRRQQREASVLLASSAGARLYPHLGYRQIAVLQAFCPVRRAG